VLFVLAVATILVAHAVEETDVVTELAAAQAQEGVTLGEGDGAKYMFDGTGGGDTHPDAESGGEGTGYFKRIANFPGPQFGLPGYKASHNWEEDFDMMSPLVFDYRFYRAMMKKKPSVAEQLSEEDLKTDFVEKAMANKSPDCPVGSIWFDANFFFTYYESESESLKMGGNDCKLIFKYYLGEFLFDPPDEGGGSIVKHVVGSEDEDQFPTIGSKIFAPEGERSADDEPHKLTEAMFQIGQGMYVETPMPNSWRTDNTFSPARHMAVVWWMRLAPQEKAPNAELFAYGSNSDDNYFRTGFGCIDKDISDTKCYWILVFSADSTFYFHTYDASNFEHLTKALKDSRWAHVVMMLTTVEPGHAGDEESRADYSCANNKADSPQKPNACNALVNMFVDKQAIKIVDWEHGTDVDKSSGSGEWAGKGWGKKINNVWGTMYKSKGSEEQTIRRFWVAPPLSCGAPYNDFSCGGTPFNGMKFGFPWFGSYMAGVYICDMVAVPSGKGLFGVHERRLLAVDAFWETMGETMELACSMDDISAADEVTNDTEEEEEEQGR